MWFLRASCKVASQTTIFGVGHNILNAWIPLNQTKRGQDLGRGNTREVTEQRLCLLADSPKGQLCSRDKGNGGDRLWRTARQTIQCLVGTGEAKTAKGQH